MAKNIILKGWLAVSDQAALCCSWNDHRKENRVDNHQFKVRLLKSAPLFSAGIINQSTELPNTDLIGADCLFSVSSPLNHTKNSRHLPPNVTTTLFSQEAECQLQPALDVLGQSRILELFCPVYTLQKGGGGVLTATAKRKSRARRHPICNVTSRITSHCQKRIATQG